MSTAVFVTAYDNDNIDDKFNSIQFNSIFYSSCVKNMKIALPLYNKVTDKKTTYYKT